jgi:hypothetical protein
MVNGRAALIEANQRVNAMIRAAGIGGEQGLAKVAINVLRIIKVELSNPGTGTLYYVRRSSRTGNLYLSATPPVLVMNGVGTHRASAPGQPPASWMGIYRRSWFFDVGVDSKGPWSMVATADERGPWLEFGTSRMRPRPHVRPAVMRAYAMIRETLVAEIVKRQEEAIRAMYAKGSGAISNMRGL